MCNGSDDHLFWPLGRVFRFLYWGCFRYFRTPTSMTASAPAKKFKSSFSLTQQHSDNLAQMPISISDGGSRPDSDEGDDGSVNLSLKIGGQPSQQLQQKRMGSELEQHYDKNIRPLLDMVDRLRTLGIMEEGIQLPSIVVVGDQSSGKYCSAEYCSEEKRKKDRLLGKSSVLESLASINLPRGQGIATRVPLVLRLQRCPPNEAPSITIEYGNAKQQITEQGIKSAVDNATTVLAGNGKGITDRPISLHIRKPTAPDLTMIDLPGITRVPVHGQPDDIYEQISAMIRHYIQPKECVILNVLSATVDFSTCESIRMSQKEDRVGERTLAVVTKVDIAPDGLYEKVTVDAVNIGLGYVCVKNRTDEEESHEDARGKEKRLFESHLALRKLDKDMVGISALAERLTLIQANMIRTCLPGIVKKIEAALVDRRKELQSLPEGVADELEAEAAFLRIMMEKRMTLERLVVHGNFQGFADSREMHYTARLQEFFTTFSDALHASGKTLRTKEKTQEILGLMAEGRGVNLPNFLNGNVFHSLVREQIFRITLDCQKLVTKVHDYIQNVVFTVIDRHADAFASMRSAYRRSAERVLGKTRDDCLAYVNRELEKESCIVYTINDYYMENIRKIKEQGIRDKAAAPSVPSSPVPNFSMGSGGPAMNPFSAVPKQPFGASSNAVPLFGASSNGVPMQPFGVAASAAAPQGTSSSFPVTLGAAFSANDNTANEYSVEEDRWNSNSLLSSASNDFQSAQDMRVSLVAYWKVVHKRLADGITFELRYAFQCAILNDLDKDVLREKASKGVSYMLNEDKSLSKKRRRLQQSVDVLQESYRLVSDLLKW